MSTQERVSTTGRGQVISTMSASQVSRPGIADAEAASEENPERAEVTDFSGSFCYFVPREQPVWTRMQIECRCEVFGRAGGEPDEYVMGTRTQCGVDGDAAGYDCWMIFSKRRVYIRRNHASSYVRDSSQVGPEHFAKSGWHLQLAEAKPLRSAIEFREALMNWRLIVARTELCRADGSRAYLVEYPIRWSDAHFESEGLRVETGPVLLVDPDRVEAGTILTLGDFHWAYLDFRKFDTVRCFFEQPTSVVECFRSPKYHEATPATPNKVEQIEERLYSGWEPPISVEALRQVFQTSHYSAVKHLKVRTRLYALDEPSAVEDGRAGEE